MANYFIQFYVKNKEIIRINLLNLKNRGKIPLCQPGIKFTFVSIIGLVKKFKLISVVKSDK